MDILKWEGCHPYDSVPVQFSCHVQGADGRVTHHEWLTDGPEDPRPALAERLVQACESAHTVVAYNAGFERGCIEQMAEVLPALATPLHSIVDRLADLLPIVRNHVYHPDFGGSFGLKTVLPALVPELGYDTLAISDGAKASVGLERLLFQGDGPVVCEIITTSLACQMKLPVSIRHILRHGVQGGRVCSNYVSVGLTTHFPMSSYGPTTERVRDESLPLDINRV